jgi:putative transcriptional regulator
MTDITYAVVLHWADGDPDATIHADTKEDAYRRAKIMGESLREMLSAIEVCRIDTTHHTTVLSRYTRILVPLDTCGTMEPQEVEPMTTKEQILAIRKSTGLSQARFGQRFGIPTRTIEDWERGLRDCPVYVAELLAFAAKTDYQTPRAKEEQTHD